MHLFLLLNGAYVNGKVTIPHLTGGHGLLQLGLPQVVNYYFHRIILGDQVIDICKIVNVK